MKMHNRVMIINARFVPVRACFGWLRTTGHHLLQLRLCRTVIADDRKGRSPDYGETWSSAENRIKYALLRRFVTNAVEMPLGTDEDAAAADGGRCQTTLAQVVLRHQFEFSARSKHMGCPIFTDGVDVAAGQNRRGGEISSQSLLPNHIAAVGVTAECYARIDHNEKEIVTDQWRRHVSVGLACFPMYVRVRHIPVAVGAHTQHVLFWNVPARHGPHYRGISGCG